MKNKNYILLFILMISLIVIYLNYLRFQSFVVQRSIYEDTIKQKDLSYRDTIFINSIKTNYPSLGLFGMPLSSQKGTYLIAKNKIYEGIQLLKQGQKENPYLMFSESQLADISYRLKDIKNYEYYSRRAFKNLPNNPLHFIQLVRLYKIQNKNDSIKYYYEKVKDIIGPKDPQVYNIVLSSFMLDKDTLTKYGGLEIAKEALAIHPKSSKLIHDFVVYSRENIDKASKLYTEAMTQLNNGKYKEGIALLDQSVNLHPNNQLYNDNYIIANYNIKNYQNISDIYSNYRSYFTEIDSDVLYYLASSLYFSENYKTSCTLLIEIEDKELFKFDKSLFSACYNLSF
tara:strand:+ start:20 stop:1045 length:1026 start_codon:yes stop_codon:yes gene_type:complete